MNNKSFEVLPNSIISDEDKAQILSSIKPYLHSRITLSEILNVDPDIYSNVLIKDIGLSVRSANAITHSMYLGEHMNYAIKTLCDFLSCTMEKISCIRNFGIGSLIETIFIIKQYISQSQEHFYNSFTYSAEINEYRLATGLKQIINDKPLNDIVFKDTEMPYVMRYMAAVEWIDKDLYMAAYNKDKYLIEILNSLSEFFAPIYRVYKYKQDIENSFIKLPRKIREKSAKYFFQAYLLNNSVLDENPLYGAAEGTTISDIVNTVCKKSHIDYNTFHYVYDFLRWLDFDFNIELSDEIRNLKGEKRQTIKIRSHRYCNRIKDLYRNFGYDVVAVIRAFKGKSRLVYKRELTGFVGKENTELLWFVLSSVNYSTPIYHYSAETDVMIFNE